MKTKLKFILGVVVFSLSVFIVYADNPCVEGGPHTNHIGCLSTGSLTPNYFFTPSNAINISVGQPFSPPDINNLSITNGSELDWITFDCGTPDYYITNGVNYTFGNLYFVPNIPSIIWFPGTYTYTGYVIANGGPCGPLTNNLGTITINAGSPDVLIDVDFGGNTHSSKTGYAAIGNSPNDQWNYYIPGGNVISGSLPNLVTAEGYVSPVGILATNLLTPGTNGSIDPMYNDYLFTNAGTATLTLTNLPAGTWNIYLYSDDGNFSLTAGGTNYGTQTCYDQPLSSPLIWQAGLQYVVYTNVTVSAGQSLRVTVNAGQGGLAMLSGLQIASIYHQPLILSDMVGWWRGENNALDSAGTNNGTMINGTLFTNGMVGNAFLINGTNYVKIPDAPALNPTNCITIECWMYRSAQMGPYDPIFKKEDVSNNNGYGLEFNNNNLLFLIYSTTSGWESSGGSVSILTNQWYHVAGVYDGSHLLCYTNGTLASSTAVTGSIALSTNYLGIGNDPGNSNTRFFNGRLDEVSIFNRALSAGEIQAIYNGKPDLVGLTGDSDYDGVNDYQELVDRTDPNNPNDVLPIQLGSWSFDNTNTWVGDQGQLPLIATNITGVLSWETNAVLIDNTNPALLTYRDVETNGNANINLRCGTIRFWFKPDWSSTNAGGVGPQTAGRLIEIGNAGVSNGWWTMMVASNGNTLSFITQTNTAGVTNLATTGITWSSNEWHQAVLTYCATNSSLYIDGLAVMTNGLGVQYWPGAADRSVGFRVGSDVNGNNQAKGTFDELETFNYPLDPISIWANYTNPSAAFLPIIVTQPLNQTVVQGTNATFSIGVLSAGPPSYQWYFNSGILAGVTNATLVINNAQTNNAGNYYVIVTNNFGSVTSSTASLTVLLLPTISITNPVNYSGFFNSPTNITVGATATAAQGTITQVQFFQGTTSLGTDTTAPYSVSWNSVTSGTYSLTAVATDSYGLVATSAVVSITVFSTNDLRLWLKADTGIINGSTNQVSTWSDQSGWAHDATQAGSTNHPLLITNVLNSLPIVRFDRTNNQYLQLSSFGMSGATSAEVLAVWKVGAWQSGEQAGFWHFGNSGLGKWIAYPGTDGTTTDDFGSSGFQGVGAHPQSLNQFHIYEVSSQANLWTAWHNGILLYQNNHNTVGFSGPYYLGGSSDVTGSPIYYFIGDMAEVMIFSRTLTAAERTVVNTYLNGKYGLGLAVPPTPTNLMATAISTSQVSLTWNFDLVSNSTASFTIERKPTGGSYAAVATITDATSYFDTNLTANTQYYYRVKASNWYGDSGYSNETNATTLASAADIPLTNLVLWVKADGGLNWLSNSNIWLWSDQSGKSNDLTQTSGGSQPVLVANCINGRPAVHFDGANYYFNMPNILNGTTGAEVFLLIRAATNNPSKNQGLWSVGTAPNHWTYYPNTAGEIADCFGSTVNGNYDIGVPPQPINQFNLYQVSSQTGNWAAWMNGLSLYQTTNNTYGYATSYLGRFEDSGGNFTYFTGDIAEALIFNRALTDAERSSVHEYLNSKYALFTNAPSAPTNLMATAVSTSQISLIWSNNLGNGSTLFTIERKLGGGTYSAIATISDATSYFDTNLTANTQYYYRVKASNWFGDSGYSNETNATTLASAYDMPLANLVLWVKADGPIGWLANGSVWTWHDQSGNQNDLTQGTGGQQPVVVTNSINGRPAVHFDGANYYFNMPNILTNTTGAEAFLIIRAKTNLPSGNQGLWNIDSAVNHETYYPNTSGHILDCFGSHVTDYYDLGIPAQPLTQYHLYQVSSQTGNWTAWINGTMLYQNTNDIYGYSPSGLGRVVDSGANKFYFSGDIAEVLVFNRTLNASERDAVGLYLFSKYGLTQFATNAVPPNATPTNLLTIGLAPLQLNLQWASTATNVTSFHIERKLGSSGTYQDIGATPSWVSNFVDTTAIPTNVYYYHVKAHNFFGDSTYSTAVSPPAVSLTNVSATLFENETNIIGAQASDDDGTVSSVQFFLNVNAGNLGILTSSPYTLNWQPTMTEAGLLSVLATDNQGNSQFSTYVPVTVYLDSNGDGIPDILQVQSGNDPINPWIPPLSDSNTNLPVINLIVPANATLVP